MMSQKGFTLVELIAMMVVLAIIMVIAVPNISGIIDNNRQGISIEDVNKMVGNTKTKLNMKEAVYPAEGTCTFLALSFIDINDDFKKGVNNGTYDMNESFVVVKKVALESGVYTYKYYIRLVENVGDGANEKDYTIGLIDYDTYSKNPQPSKLENLEGKRFSGITDTMAINNLLKKINGNVSLCNNITVYR